MQFDASFGQQRLWFVDRLEPGAATYNVPWAVRIHGALEAPALERALASLVARHEVLRTTLPEVDGRPVQEIHDTMIVPFVSVDLRGVAEADREAAVRAQIHTETHRGFDLAVGPLVRALLVRVADEEHVFVITMHHVVTDGWSLGIIARELSAFYASECSGKSAALRPLELQYADYAGWQRESLTEDVLKKQLGYWKEHLRGAPTTLELPTDRPRPAIKQQRGARVDVVLSGDVLERLHSLERAERATRFMVLLAAFDVVVARHTGQPDVVVGTPLAGRTRAEVEPLIGFFVNTVPLRIRLDGEPTFRDVVRRAKESTLAAQEHQDVPFERIVEELGLRRDPSRTPLVQATFALNPTPAAFTLGALRATQELVALDVAKFDLVLEIVEQSGSLHCSWDYDTALFDAATTRRMAEHFGVLLEAALAAPDTRIAALPMLTNAERELVLDTWNATARPFDASSVHDTIARRATDTPEAIAIAHGDRQWTYGEMNRRANRIARVLRRRGVGAEVRVATLFERSGEMIIAQLAVLVAGGAYVPLDSTHPAQRLAFILADVGAKLVLSTRGVSSKLDLGAGAVVVDLDDPAIEEELAREPDDDLARSSGPHDAAYVIYTSGTTGQPKGALVEHRSLANLVSQQLRLVAGTAADRVSQLVSPAFDGTMNEIWPTLACGATLDIVDDDVRKSPAELAAWLRKRAVTVAYMTTPLAESILDESWSGAALRVLLTGGQALQRRPKGDEPFRLVNIYGPTEATDYVTSEDVEPGRHPVTTIGRPIQNTAIYVVDAAGGPAPIGVYGEILIGGANVGRGYVGKPALTAEKLVPDPFGATPGARLYRTGDRGRWLADGRLEFSGRFDDQVKIRGYRIELGEITATISAHEGIREVVVVAREDLPGDKRIVAYVAPSSPAFDVEVLKTSLLRSLPAYMLPSAFVVLERLPLTANGKVDRGALPAPDFGAAATEYVAPRNATEETVARVFCEVLGLERVGVHDDFFALGGHSLMGARVASRLRTALGTSVSVWLLFDAPTPAALAERLVELASAAAIGTAAGAAITELPLVKAKRENSRLPLSRMQERLWFLEKLEPSSNAYLLPTATRLRGELRADALEKAFAELTKRHELLRTTFEEKGETVVQVLHEAPPLRWERRDLTRVPADQRERTLKEQMRREAATPFDLRRHPPVRVKLLALDANDHVLLFTMHHLLSDGWSQGVIVRELAALYEAFVAGVPSPLAPLAFQYGDYAVWDREHAATKLDGQLAYWKGHLAGAPAALELPTDRPRPAVQKHRGARVTGHVSESTAERLRKLGRERGATMYMTLLAAFTALLGRLSGQSDVVVATPVVNRPHPELEGIIGFFMNTIAVRVDTSGQPTFEELLVRAREASLGAYANQDVPFERIVQEINPSRDMSRNPIAQVSLNVLNLPDMNLRFGGLEAQPLDEGTGGSKFDITLYVEDRLGNGLGLDIVYDPELFDEARVLRLIRRFEVLLDAVAERPATPVADVSLVSNDERRVLPEPTAPLAAGELRSIAARFDDHVEATPEGLAVTDAHRTWSYAELARRANQLAHLLRARGAGSGDVVAIFAERNALTVWALLGVLKSGAAFMLLDAEYPSARLVEQLAIGKPVAWINAAESTAVPAEVEAAMPPRERFVDLRDPSEPWAASPATSPDVVVTSSTLAYVVFTSGTTGGPKGIAGGHGPIAHFVDWHARTHGFGPNDRFSALSGLAHDPFLRDVFTPLTAGASLSVPPQELRLEPDALAAWLAKERITACHLTPSLGEVLGLARGPSLTELRYLFFAGEALRSQILPSIRKLAPGARFVNFYGATETPQAMGCYTVRESDTGVIPIGRGIDGVQLLVLNASGGLAGIDEEGEIWVRTQHLAIGYLDGDARGFRINPFTRADGDRVYRTGDRGRYLEDGSVEAVGRRDDQVKVRGFRVELSEVTDALGALPGVRQAAVVFDDRRRTLAAYVVGDVDAAEVRQQLAKRLPDYMIPSSFTALDSMPLTPNGKIDRRALPAPSEHASAGGSKGESFEPGSVEATIADIWKAVMRLDEVALHDNFFDVGGHSLLATQLSVRLREAFDVEITVRNIFEGPTIAELAEKVVNALLDSASPETLAAAMADLKREGGA